MFKVFFSKKETAPCSMDEVESYMAVANNAMLQALEAEAAGLAAARHLWNIYDRFLAMAKSWAGLIDLSVDAEAHFAISETATNQAIEAEAAGLVAAPHLWGIANRHSYNSYVTYDILDAAERSANEKN